MENNDQKQVSSNEKLNDIHVNENMDDNLMKKVLSVRSEESILHQVSKEIDDFMKSNIYTRRNAEEYINENNIINYSKQKELEKQVLTGEITPFTAIEKQSNLIITKGTFNKSSCLLDLEKYLQQQAELAKQKKQLKENSKIFKHNINHVLSTKKPKLSNTSFKKCRTLKKIKSNINKKKLVSEFKMAKKFK